MRIGRDDSSTAAGLDFGWMSYRMQKRDDTEEGVEELSDEEEVSGVGM